MIFFHDAASQREAQSPTALLGGEARCEDILDIFLLYALARIDYLDGNTFILLKQPKVYAPSTLHGINGILAEIFNDPLEKRSIHLYPDIVVGEMTCYLHFLRRTTVHIVDHVFQNLIHRGINGLWQRTYLRETLGNELQALHVFVKFRNKFIVGIILFEYFHPSHQRGDRSAQLMGSLFRQAYPHLVLLGPFRGQQGENGHNNENHDDA